MREQEIEGLTPEQETLVGEYKAGNLSRRRFMTRIGALGIGLPAAAGILAACGADDDDAAPTGSGGTPADTGGDAEDAPEPEPDSGGPVTGGTLREGYNRDVSKHDPLTTNWYDPAFFAIYEAILSNDPDGNDVAQFASDFSVSRWPDLSVHDP